MVAEQTAVILLFRLAYFVGCRSKLLQVLVTLDYIDAENAVQLKGRVASEVNTCDELILTELVFENARFFSFLPPQICCPCCQLLARVSETHTNFVAARVLHVTLVAFFAADSGFAPQIPHRPMRISGREDFV